MSKYLMVVPAYGRDYISAKAVRTAWAEGKDFVVRGGIGLDISREDGRYINNAEANASGITVNVRYNGARSICVIPPEKGKPRQDKPDVSTLPGIVMAFASG